MCIKGLLRKYKISKISDNVKLSESELTICNYLYVQFLNLNTKTTYKYSIRYFNDKDETSFSYDCDTKTLNISYKIHRHLIEYGLTSDDIKIIIIDWIIDIYGLEINIFNILFFEANPTPILGGTVY